MNDRQAVKLESKFNFTEVIYYFVKIHYLIENPKITSEFTFEEMEKLKIERDDWFHRFNLSKVWLLETCFNIATEKNDFVMSNMAVECGLFPGYDILTSTASKKNVEMAALMIRKGANFDINFESFYESVSKIENSYEANVSLAMVWKVLQENIMSRVILIPYFFIENINQDIVHLLQYTIYHIYTSKLQTTPNQYMKHTLLFRPYLTRMNMGEDEILKEIKKMHSQQIEIEKSSWHLFPIRSHFDIKVKTLEDCIRHALYEDGDRTLLILINLKYLYSKNSLHESAPAKFRDVYERVKLGDSLALK